VREGKKKSRETDKQVNNIFKPGQLAENKIYNVPVTAYPITDCDKTPIEASDYNKNKRYTVKYFHAF
jgi:hypothetical protein